ncbi:ABC transporter permease [Brucella intermedia]|uniref:ABC transporter permease n=1 Tax=Brucella intermedia TaxID=94625 RepID=UPI0009C15511|nr:ABC transporter permease [Brucella intermedia]
MSAPTLNPHLSPSINPLVMTKMFFGQWGLILSLSQREVIGRYRGSIFGLLWSFINPLLMLVVYTFVFSVVFKARWVGGSESKTEFALALFTGLMVFNLFAECVIRAPGLILSNVNYVKKVIFPLEVLPVVSLISALFHYCISLIVWVIFYFVFFGTPDLGVFLLPVALFPFCLLILGVTWFLSSLGVYLRDISQIIGVLTTVLMFLSPIFYPIEALPEVYRPLMELSPLTTMVVQVRDLMLWGKGMNWSVWTTQLIVSSMVAWLGFAWFQKTRKGFADVI